MASASAVRLGTPAPVGDLAAPRASADPREVTRHGSWVYFLADGEAGDGALWRAASAGGRLELVDASRPWGRLIAAGSRLFAVAADRTAVGRVDGDAGGVGILAEPRYLVNEPTAVGDRLFFAADHPLLGEELWTSDGSPGGTGPVADLAAGPESARPTDFTPFGGGVLFAAAGDGAGPGSDELPGQLDRHGFPPA
jgi:ELWxxDGT repeat protein